MGCISRNSFVLFINCVIILVTSEETPQTFHVEETPIPEECRIDELMWCNSTESESKYPQYSYCCDKVPIELFTFRDIKSVPASSVKENVSLATQKFNEYMATMKASSQAPTQEGESESDTGSEFWRAVVLPIPHTLQYQSDLETPDEVKNL